MSYTTHRYWLKYQYSWISSKWGNLAEWKKDKGRGRERERERDERKKKIESEREREGELSGSLAAFSRYNWAESSRRRGAHGLLSFQFRDDNVRVGDVYPPQPSCYGSHSEPCSLWLFVFFSNFSFLFLFPLYTYINVYVVTIYGPKVVSLSKNLKESNQF